MNNIAILLIIILFTSLQSIAQSRADSLLNELREAIYLDCKEMVDAISIDRDCRCKIDDQIVTIKVTKCQPSFEVVETIVDEIMQSKDTSIISDIIDIENQFVDQMREAFLFFEENHRSCSFIKVKYDIAMMLEMCIKSLNLVNHIDEPAYMFNEFVRYRDYWLSILVRKEAKHLKPDIKFQNELINQHKNRFHGRRTSLVFINPYVSMLDTFFIKDLESVLSQYSNENYLIKRKFVKTKAYYLKFASNKIDSLLISHEPDKYRFWIEVLFELLPSREDPHIEYLVDLLYTDSFYKKAHEYSTRSSFHRIYTNPWGGIYPDRTKNTEKARNILEQKILERAKKTKTFHRTSNILADTYRDERMAKLLLDIYPLFKNIEDKSKIKKLLNKHSPVLNNYSEITIKSMKEREVIQRD